MNETNVPTVSVLKDRKKLLIIGGAAVVVLAAVTVYEVILPSSFGKSYNKQLHSSQQALHGSLVKVADGATRPIFTNPDSTTGSDKNDIVILKDSVADAEAKLKSFNEATRQLKSLPLSGFFGSYRDAKNAQHKANEAADKVRTELASYKELVNYLENMNKSESKFEEQTAALDDLENATDIETLTKNLKDGAAAIQTLARDAKNITVPADFKELHDKNIAIVDEFGVAMDELAKAIEGLDSDAINAAVEKVDAVMEKGDALEKDIQAKIGQDSKYMRELKGLPTLTDTLN
jgi:hypothetical protein